jgi:hypothetical protein
LTTVLCVLKSGGDYEPAHAARLFDQFLEHAPMGCEFLCLTDMLPELDRLHVPATSLVHGWPGWWSKIEAFASPGPCLYLDLDTSIVGDLGPLLEVAQREAFVVCGNFWVQDPHKINSSVMAWKGDASQIYQKFAEAPDAHMDVYRTREKWGDQAFISDFAGIYGTWQALTPGAVVSYKRGVLQGENLAGMIVCVSHGLPKPWSAGGADEWLKKHGKLR